MCSALMQFLVLCNQRWTRHFSLAEDEYLLVCTSRSSFWLSGLCMGLLVTFFPAFEGDPKSRHAGWYPTAGGRRAEFGHDTGSFAVVLPASLQMGDLQKDFQLRRSSCLLYSPCWTGCCRMRSPSAFCPSTWICCCSVDIFG